MRAADADRQAVADRLRAALDEGRLDLHEYDERLQRAYAAKTYGELDGLLADLPGRAPRRALGAGASGAGAVPRRRARPAAPVARRRAGSRRPARLALERVDAVPAASSAIVMRDLGAGLPSVLGSCSTSGRSGWPGRGARCCCPMRRSGGLASGEPRRRHGGGAGRAGPGRERASGS